MKICGISDMHGQLEFKIDECDVVCICGDISPLSMQVNGKKMKKWMKNMFLPWIEGLPCEKVFLVGGNHDFVFEYYPNIIKEVFEDSSKLEYLNNTFTEYKGKKFLGTPMCKVFGNWAFMAPLEEEREQVKKLLEEDKADVVLLHDTPYGTSDIILQKCPWADGTHIGNVALKELLEEMQPSLCLHGHIHSSNHEKEMLGETSVYNVSLLDESYKMKYKPLYIELD